MIYWIDAKTFKHEFLQNESYKDILDSQYVLVSTRIRTTKKYENIISASSILFPNIMTCSNIDDEGFREGYFNQLDENKAFIATLIKGSIEKNYNIIFMCSKNELKMHYLEYLSDYVYINFDYPIYNYHMYSIGACKLLKYNKEKVVKKCDKILSKAKVENFKKQKSISSKNKNKELSKWSKKELKKELDKLCLYSESMSKKDMIDLLIEFL